MLLGAHGVFWLFGAVLVSSVAFVYFLVPETRGKTLEDIERLFSDVDDGLTTNTRAGEAISKRPIHVVSSIANLKATPSIIL